MDASFQGVNRFFVLSFKDDDCRENYKQYYLVMIDNNVMIDRRKFFDLSIKNYLKTDQNIRKMQPVKVMIKELDVYYIMPISKNTIN